jgi:hypothetical protein
MSPASNATINQSGPLNPRRLVLMNARIKRRWSDLCGEAEVEENLETTFFPKIVDAEMQASSFARIRFSDGSPRLWRQQCPWRPPNAPTISVSNF